MSIGAAAGGAADALTKIIEQRLERQKLEALIRDREASLAESQRSSQADEAYRTRSLDIQEAEARQRADERATAQREKANVLGVRRMAGEFITQGQGDFTPEQARGLAGLQIEAGQIPDTDLLRPPPEKKYPVTTVGPGGGPVNKLVTEGELSAGVPGYRAPQQPTQPRTSAWVVRGGKVIPVQPGSEQPGDMPYDPVAARGTTKPPTGLQNSALGFYNRMKDAIETMDAVEGQLPQKDLFLINNSPLPELINNPLLSPAGRRYAQSLRTYTEARLRKESGAAIEPKEFDQDRLTIGRQVGDDPDTLQQKQRVRRKTAKGIGFIAGPAYEAFYGEPLNLKDDDEMVDMVHPDGSLLKVPASKVAEAEAAGARRK